MKTSIVITGSGITSKTTLLNSIPCYSEQIKKLNFNNFLITFNTKKEAVKALSDAYQTLISDFDIKFVTDYSRGKYLAYDAGTARLEKI